MYTAFKMKPLPKPEYLLLKALQKQYQLASPTELFTLALRLMYEVQCLDNANVQSGKAWIVDMLDALQSTPESERVYNTNQQ